MTTLHIDKQAETVTVTGMPRMEQILLQVGSERSAIRHAQRLYDLDRDTATLLTQAVRHGEEEGT